MAVRAPSECRDPIPRAYAELKKRLGSLLRPAERISIAIAVNGTVDGPTHDLAIAVIARGIFQN